MSNTNTDKLALFLAKHASAETRTNYTTATQTINHNTIHVHMAPDRASQDPTKRRKPNVPTIDIDPATFQAGFITTNAKTILDPHNTALGAESKLQFLYPLGAHYLAQSMHQAQILHRADPSVSAIPTEYAGAILAAATNASTNLSTAHRLQLDLLELLAPSDPDTTRDLFGTIWKFYLENPLAIAAFLSAPADRVTAAKSRKAFILPCPICNPACAALRDRLNTKDIFIPHRPTNKGRDRSDIHDNAVTRYLTIPNLLTHCQTVSHPTNEPFVMLHRYLANFFNNLDSMDMPLHDAINTDYYNLIPNQEPIEDEVLREDLDEVLAEADEVLAEAPADSASTKKGKAKPKTVKPPAADAASTKQA